MKSPFNLLIYFILFNLILLNWTSLNGLGAAITDQHKLRLKSLFNLNQKVESANLPNLFYSLVGLDLLHNNNLNAAFQTSDKKTELCTQLKSFLNQKDNQQLDDLYHVSSSLKLLNCAFDTAQLASLIESEINEQATVLSLYRAIVSLENAGKPIPSAKIVRLLNAQLAKDESYLSAGLALQIASKLARNDQLQFVNRIPNLIASADEVDGKYLQYEGGLGITASIFKGILDLSTSANKSTTLTDRQVLKFLNYFLNRLTVQTTKNAAELLQILKLLSNNKYHIPVVVSLYGSNVINEENTNIVLRVTNAFGTSLGKDFRITAKVNDLSNVFKFTVVHGDSTLYALDILQSKNLPAGNYNLKITVEPVKPDKLFVISNDIKFNTIIQTKVNLDSIEIGVGEKDQFAIKHEPVEYPISLKERLEVDNTQKISIKYCVRDPIQSKDLTVQQSQIHFVNEKTNREIIFIADQDRISKVYNKDINLAYKGKDFNYQSGDYSIRLVVGDSLISESISWTLGKVNIQFNNQEEDVESCWMNRYKAKPEIEHLFKQPEQRPSEFVSHAFTALALSPALLLVFCWSKIDLNFKKFRFSLNAILFHGSLVLVFALYTLFFIRLNMFTTIKCLSGVFVVLFLSGHFLLKSLGRSSSNQ